jgi:hypothetical protein
MNPKVVALAQAIAKAEGFGPAENLPTRCCNPGDLELGDLGYGTEGGKTVFATEQLGWVALEEQCRLMLTGESHVYRTTDTFAEVAEKYTGGDNSEAWAETVALELGIDVETTLKEYYDAEEENPNDAIT